MAGNVGNGISVLFGTATVLGNSVHSNGELGIKLGIGNEPTPNDNGDADAGANDLQNFPVIVSLGGSITGHTQQ